MTDAFEDRFKGVLFGQAVGDALGLGTEFMSRAQVRDKYPDGLSAYEQNIRDARRKRRRDVIRLVRVKLVNAPLLHPRHQIGVHRLRKRRIARLTGWDRVPLRQVAEKIGIRTKVVKVLGMNTRRRGWNSEAARQR